MLSMGQAATEAGISKSTLSRAIKSGRLSANRTDQGGFLIDPAELFRVYPRNDATGDGNRTMAHHATGTETDETPALKAEIEGLRAQLTLMREQLDEQRNLMRDQIDDVKEQRDLWQRQAEAASLRMIPDQRRGLFSFFKKAG